MIRPSHAERRFSANREFTDRDDDRQLFDAACEDDQPRDAYKVLMWYGVGGQGKSALARECERRLEVLKSAAVNRPRKRRYGIAKVDFEDARLRDIHEALLSLRLQLSRSVGLSFPAFDTAFARYFALSNPGVNMRQRHPELFRGENELLDDLLDWSEEGIASMAIVAAVDAGLAVPGVNVIYKYTARLRGRAIEWWERRGKSVLTGLDALRPDELLEKLPTFLGSDICDGLQADAALRPVILLDTYEALWRDRGLADGETALRADRWVRRLVQDAPGVLFVLFGRDRLRWSEEDADWSSAIDDHLLGELSVEDSEAFLKKVPVEDAGIREKIIEGAKGLPFYLDLQVDLFEGLRNQGNEPDAGQFGGTHALILTRFLDHLSENEKALLRLASYPLVLDQATMNDLAAAFLGGAAHVNWRSLTSGRSFMSPGSDGTAIMHVLLREALQQREREERPQLFRDIHQYLFQHFDAECVPGECEPLTTAHEIALRNGLHHLVNAAADQVFDWIDGHYPMFHQAARRRTLEAVLRQALEVVRSEHGDDNINTLTIRHNNAEQIGHLGRFAEAEQEFRAVWKMQQRPEILGEDHPVTLKTQHNIAYQIANQGRFAEAVREYRAVWEIQRRPEILGEDHPDTLSTRHNIAHQIAVLGHFADAEAEFRTIWEILRRPEALGEEHPDTLTSRKNLAQQIANQGRHADAEQEFRAIWEIERRPDILGEEHPSTLTTRMCTAREIGEQGRYAEAEQELRAVWEIQERPEILGEDHPDTLRTQHVLAQQIGRQGRDAEAEQVFRSVWEVRRRPDILGEEHHDTLITRHNIAYQIASQGHYADAEREFRVVWEILRRPEVLGEEHPQTLIARANMAQQLGNQGSFADAERELRAVWEILRRPEVLGEEHPQTLTTRANMAQQIGKQARYAEAEQEFREVWQLQRRPEALGEDHVNHLRTRYWLAKMLDGQGKSEDASSLLKGLKEAMEDRLGPDHNWLKELNEYLSERLSP